MRRIAVVVLSMTVLACSDGPVSPPADSPQFARLDDTDQGGQLFTTSLSGDEEAPPRETPGSGSFAMTVNPGLGLLCYELEVQDLLAAVTASHIHVAPAGVPGPVVVPLTAPVEGSSSGCISVADDLLLAIRKNPEAYYVNVHSTLYPGGEVRGQLGD